MINEQKIKIIISIKAVILIITLIALFSSSLYMKKVKLYLIKKEKKLDESNRLISIKIKEFNAKTKDVESLLSTWKKLTIEGENFQGLKIQNSKEVIDKLKIKYRFKDISIKLSKPKISQAGKIFAVESSVVNVVIKSYLDIHILQFMEALRSEIPGYVEIIDYKINLDSSIDNDFFRKMNNGADLFPISATINFNWSDLKKL